MEKEEGKYLDVAYSYSEKPKSEYPRLLMQHLLHDVLNIRSGTVVDVGSGRGDQLEAIKGLGFDTIGLDRERPFNEELEFYSCDITKDVFPIPDGIADVVFCKSVVEHLYLFQMEHFFSEIKRVCKSGGYILVSTPDWEYNSREYYQEFTHCTPFTLRSMRHCLEIHGFTEVSTYSLIPLPPTWNSTALRWFSDLINLLSPPKRWGKWCKWSQERQIIAWGQVFK